MFMHIVASYGAIQVYASAFYIKVFDFYSIIIVYGLALRQLDAI